MSDLASRALIPEGTPALTGGPKTLTRDKAFTPGAPMTMCHPPEGLSTAPKLAVATEREWDDKTGHGAYSGVFVYDGVSAKEALDVIHAAADKCDNMQMSERVSHAAGDIQLPDPGVAWFGFCVRHHFTPDDFDLFECTAYFGRDVGWGVIAAVGMLTGDKASAERFVIGMAPTAVAQLTKA
ncbi:hypothetical protein [Longispora urticae]